MIRILRLTLHRRYIRHDQTLSKEVPKYYKVKGKISLKVNFQQLRLVEHYQALQAENALPSIDDTGLKIFSQFEEDGKLLYLFSLLNMSNRTFIEFGSDDGVNSNSANLYYHHLFTGLFMDGNPDAIDRGQHFFSRHKNVNPSPVIFKEAHIKVDNINELIKSAGMEGEIGLLSIDIDGNDYWIWKAIY